jgi:hypothetical protein
VVGSIPLASAVAAVLAVANCLAVPVVSAHPAFVAVHGIVRLIAPAGAAAPLPSSRVVRTLPASPLRLALQVPFVVPDGTAAATS